VVKEATPGALVADRDMLQNAGMAFLEHRVPPPIVLAATAVLMWFASRSSAAEPFGSWRFYPGAALIILGLGIAVSGRLAFARAGTTINPMKIDQATALVRSGVFRYTRNPMYLGMAALLIGLAFVFGKPWLFLGPVFFALYIHYFQILPEERAMAAKFGRAFEEYRLLVRRWI
jgi:protein-S-isoprenylcysteine O-methyltransferase Ste14